MKLFRMYLPVIVMVCLFLLPVTAARGQVFATTASTAGSNTVTTYEGEGLTAVHMAWTSNSSGVVTTEIVGLAGTIERVVFAPVAAASPTAAYDIVLNDLCDVDLLQGEGANLSATAGADAVPLIAESASSATTHNKVPLIGAVDFKVTNAGASKQGLCTIIVSH